VINRLESVVQLKRDDLICWSLSLCLCVGSCIKMCVTINGRDSDICATNYCQNDKMPGTKQQYIYKAADDVFKINEKKKTFKAPKHHHHHPLGTSSTRQAIIYTVLQSFHMQPA
jgi:hypothetical protein